jgi:hypothetical protein
MDFSRSGDADSGVPLSPRTNEYDLLDVLEDFFLLEHLQHPEITLFATTALQWQSILGRNVNNVNAWTQSRETRKIANCWFNGYGLVYIVWLRSSPLHLRSHRVPVVGCRPVATVCPCPF